jgi:hypothetical protein
MAVRDSKRALAEVAALLGTNTVAARGYLRRVQQLVGPVPYDTIVGAMHRVDDFDAERVAAVVNEERSRSAVGDRTGSAAGDRTGTVAREHDGAQDADVARGDG